MAKEGRKFALGAVIAAAAGYLAGILTAPKSGKETRKDIQNAAVKTKAEAEKALKNLHSELADLIKEAKQKAKDLSDTAKEELTGAVEKAQTAKEKTREILSAIHEGGANDEDLQRAIDEAKKAASYLKQYIKNAPAGK